MKVSAIIAAGGDANRLGSPKGKQLLQIKGYPLLYYSIKTIRPLVEEVILVIRPSDIEKAKNIFSHINHNSTNLINKFVKGGNNRLQSVYNALKVVAPDTDIVLIHDGARPLVSERIIKESIQAAKEHGAVVTAVPVKDTVKITDSENTIKNTPDRKFVFAAQTPQTFHYDIIKKAYDTFIDDTTLTDDSSLVEKLGNKVKIIKGDYLNFKVTTDEDLKLLNIVV